jgi:hypothetical protein
MYMCARGIEFASTILRLDFGTVLLVIKKIPVKESELSATHLVSTIKGHNHHSFLRRSSTLRQAIGGSSMIIVTTLS